MIRTRLQALVARTTASAVFTAGVIAMLAAPQPAAAQAWPSRPVRLVVPYAAGGGADFVARTLAQGLTTRLGQQVVVDNKPGGAATIGADIVAKSAPDGYTLLYGTPAPQIINPVLLKKLPYDPVHDFAPVAPLAAVGHVLVVHPSLPVKDTRELIAYAKANPGRVNFSSAGVGATSHLDAELFKSLAGIDIVHVPYKGTSEAIQDLVAGNVQMAMDSIAPLLPHIRAGRLRALGVTATERSPLLPQVPSIGEQLPGFSATTENYLAVRTGTPPAIIARLNQAVNEVLQSPEVREHLAASGVTPTGGSPEDLRELIRRESAKWKRVIEVSGAAAP